MLVLISRLKRFGTTLCRSPIDEYWIAGPWRQKFDRDKEQECHKENQWAVEWE